MMRIVTFGEIMLRLKSPGQERFSRAHYSKPPLAVEKQMSRYH